MSHKPTTSHEATTFENENVKVSLKREPGCRVHLEITASPKATQASRHQALKTINKEISIPGFRKGKAPEAMIVKNFGTHIEKEWKDILLNTAFEEAIRLTKVYPFNNKSVKSATIKSISLENGAVLLYDYEESPQVPEIHPQDLKIKHVKRPEVKEEDINNAIEELLLQRAEWVDITDRPVEEGDFVELDIDIISEPARHVCAGSRFGVAPGKMDTWMRRLVIGMKTGDTSEGMSEKGDDEEKDAHEDCHECTDGTHDHDHKHEHEEFKPALCRITVQSIKQAKMPELNDEFAQKFGATNLQDLQEKVTASLNNRAEEYQKNQQRSLMEQALLKKYPFDIPHSFVQGQLKDQKKGMIDYLRQQGVDESSIPEEAKKLEESVTHKIDRDMRLYFMTQNLARENKIHVSEEEVSMEWMRQMWMQRMGQGDSKLDQDPKEAQSQLQLQLLTIKTLDFLIEKAHQS